MIGVKAELTRNLNEGYLNKHGEFASNPMLLTFCIMNYPSYQSFYDNPHEFYRSAYDIILSDHDLEKSPLDRVFRSADSQDDFTDVFREFCAVSYVERKFQFNKMTFEAIFKKLKSTKQVANPRIMNKTNFLHDACATACMMYEAKSDILYIDPGFQQFLFAEYNYFAEPKEVEAMGKKLWTVPESEFNGGIAFEMLYELSAEKVEVCLELPYLDMIFKDKTEEESFNAFLIHGFREIKSALLDRTAIAECEQKSGIVGKYAIASKSEPKSVILSMMLKRLNVDMDDPSAMIAPLIDMETLYPEAESKAIIGERIFDQSTQKYFLNFRKVERDKVEKLAGRDFVLTDDSGKVITFGYEYKADMGQLEKRLERYMALFSLVKSDEVIKKKYERLKAYYVELVEKHRNNEF